MKKAILIEKDTYQIYFNEIMIKEFCTKACALLFLEAFNNLKS